MFQFSCREYSYECKPVDEMAFRNELGCLGVSWETYCDVLSSNVDFLVYGEEEEIEEEDEKLDEEEKEDED